MTTSAHKPLITSLSYERSELVGELFAALHKAQKEFPEIEKRTENPYFTETQGRPVLYADYNDIRAAVDPVLDANDLTITQFPSQTVNGEPALTTWLHHKSGQFIADTSSLSLKKSDPQAQGSAITYMKRYALTAVLQLKNVDADDDGNVASLDDRRITSKGKPVSSGGASRANLSKRAELEVAFKHAGMSIAKGTKWYHDNYGKDYKSETDDTNLAAAIVKLPRLTG